MNKDWLFKTEEYICDVRTVGVLFKDNKILVQRDVDGNEYALPGGHIKVGETLEDGLVREFKEETNADIECRRLLWTEECFWEWNGKKAHNLAYYFLIEQCSGSEILEKNDFMSQKDNCNVILEWMPIDKVKTVIIYPEFLKNEIDNLSEYPKHFISK